MIKYLLIVILVLGVGLGSVTKGCLHYRDKTIVQEKQLKQYKLMEKVLSENKEVRKHVEVEKNRIDKLPPGELDAELDKLLREGNNSKPKGNSSK